MKFCFFQRISRPRYLSGPVTPMHPLQICTKTDPLSTSQYIHQNLTPLFVYSESPGHYRFCVYRSDDMTETERSLNFYLTLRTIQKPNTSWEMRDLWISKTLTTWLSRREQRQIKHHEVLQHIIASIFFSTSWVTYFSFIREVIPNSRCVVPTVTSVTDFIFMKFCSIPTHPQYASPSLIVSFPEMSRPICSLNQRIQVSRADHCYQWRSVFQHLLDPSEDIPPRRMNFYTSASLHWSLDVQLTWHEPSTTLEAILWDAHSYNTTRRSPVHHSVNVDISLLKENSEKASTSSSSARKGIHPWLT